MPLVQRVGRLDVVMSIDEQGSLIRCSEPFRVDDGVAVCLVNLCLVHADFEQVDAEPFGHSIDVGFVFGEGADGGDGEDVL